MDARNCILVMTVCFLWTLPTHAADSPGAAPFIDKALANWQGLVADHWTYKDGSLIGVTPHGQKFNTFLCSKKTYRDFELKFQVWLTGESANSGVQIRSEIFDAKHFAVRGPQCDMGQVYWASLYGEHFGGPKNKSGLAAGGMMKQAPPDVVKRVLKVNGFNDYSIKCVGNHVTIKLNGQTTVDDDFPTLPREGIIAWQIHAGPPLVVIFRNIDFTEIGNAR